MRTAWFNLYPIAPLFPPAPSGTDGWSSKNCQDETTRCLLLRLLVHALRKKNLPEGNVSNPLWSPKNQICRGLATKVCHSFIAFFFIIKPVLAYRCRGLVVEPGPGSLRVGVVTHQLPPTPNLPPSTTSGYHRVLAIFISTLCL